MAALLNDQGKRRHVIKVVLITSLLPLLLNDRSASCSHGTTSMLIVVSIRSGKPTPSTTQVPTGASTQPVKRRGESKCFPKANLRKALLNMGREEDELRLSIPQ